MRLACLGDGEGAGPSGDHGQGNAGEDEAGEDGDGQDIFPDLAVTRGVGQAKDDVLDLVVHASTSLEGAGLRVGREVVQIGLEEPEGLESVRERASAGGGGEHTHQKRGRDRLLAEIEQELLEGHGLVVDTDYEVT